MQILHPVFTVTILILIGYSFLEVYGREIKNYKTVWFVVILLIIFAGFRKGVGADYPIYQSMYSYFPLHIDYAEIFSKALFQKNSLEIEWLYLLFNNTFFLAGLPFFIFTAFVAIIALIPKFYTIEKYVAYPATGLLLYIIPAYFIADCGQIRQGLAMAVAIFSFKYIKERNLLMFLIVMYFALGFHKSAAVFVPAYWLAKVPLTKTKIIALVLFCMALSPFEIYNNLGFLNAIAPQEVYQGYSDYVNIEGGETGIIKFFDLISLLYVFFIVTLNEETCAKIPYYEYMRNLGLCGVCLFFVMRGSPIFSTRLPGIYMFFAAMILPNNLASIADIRYKKFLHLILVLFVVFYYFVFASYQGRNGRFTPDRYQNYLWN
ncbi:EpsG family protein [Halpernia frigidisoli]|uniref:EpsG family protein n=1 Tax=Halpernia frigidisoli TaxID=1125876 RepID=A0A1I3I6N4_9FLAO|nr:EpsG family protein [Halpernia frigidisoli]SFI43675.1 EpsG family protein [Halpernia frigidisoli]